MNTKSLLAWMLLGVVAPAMSLPAQAPQGKTYLDLFHGFSLVAPAAAERSDERSTTQLVSWRMRDDKTGAVLWTLTASKVGGVEADDLEAHAKALAQTLKEKELFNIDSSEVRQIAGRNGIDLKGKVSGKRAWWQRQVWVEGYPTPRAAAKGRSFIVLRITGPAGSSDAMDAAMTDLLKTLKIIDPKEAVKQREKNLKAGAEFLKTLTPEKIEKAIQKEEWYGLSRIKGETNMGQVIVQSHIQGAAKGIGVRLDAFHSSEGKTMHAIVKMSTTADRASGSYHQHVPLREGDDYGFVQDNWKIQGRKTPATQPVMTDATVKTIPLEIRGCYLPTAFQSILPQLLDLNKPATYGFAVYTARLNAFDVYTITVVGRAKIDLGGKQVQAYEIDIQPAEDCPLYQQYVDENGRVIRIVAAGVVDAVDRKAFLKAFPKAAEMIGKD